MCLFSSVYMCVSLICVLCVRGVCFGFVSSFSCLCPSFVCVFPFFLYWFLCFPCFLVGSLFLIVVGFFVRCVCSCVCCLSWVYVSLVGVCICGGRCMYVSCVSLLSVFLCLVGFCSPGCLCVLGFCVFGVFFGVLGGCLWGVFFVFWRVSGVLFCWGGGFWG